MPTQASTTRDWQLIPFTACLQKVKISRDKQIKEKDYFKIGIYPIVDQGKSLVAGFTDHKDKLISDLQPFIIFGDHTRILKYIDFPMALGADGTRVIKPNDDFDAKFFFYYLKNLEIPSRGYNRHYSILKEKEIMKPPLPTQRAIARILNTVQDVIAAQEELITKLKELKQSMMKQLFTHGTRGEKTKMTEIGEVPESWEVVELGRIGDIVTGSTPSTKKDEYYTPKEIDFIAPADIGYGRYIYSADKQISRKGYEVSRAIPKDTICCVCIGSSIGKVAKTHKKESTTNQQINSIVPSKDFDSDFIYYLMVWHSNYWKGYSTFGPVPILSKGAFGKVQIPVSLDKDEQAKIAEILVSIDQKIETTQQKLSIYKNLFKTLLHELMSGEREVNI